MATTSVGKLIRFYRNSLRLTVNDVHDRTQISIAALAKYETGIQTPSDEHLTLLADLFQTTVDDLLHGELPEPVANPVQESKLPTKRHRRRHDAWEKDDPLLLETVLNELRSGGTLDDAFVKFSESSRRAKGSVGVHYYTNLRPHHAQALYEAKEQGKALAVGHTRTEQTKSSPAQSDAVDPIAYVAWTMSKLSAQERRTIQQWVSERHSVLTKDELNLAAKSKLSVTFTLL